MKKFFTILFKTLITFFASIGLVLTFLFVASLFHITDVSGTSDSSSAILNAIAHKITGKKETVLGVTTTSTNAVIGTEYNLLCRLNILKEYAPTNAESIYKAYVKTHSDALLTNMLSAVDFHLLTSKQYIQEVKTCDSVNNVQPIILPTNNLFSWSQTSDTWDILIKAIKKDSDTIHKAAKVTGIDARILVTPLFVEQWREYTSERELFKNILKPFETLATSTNFSLGTMNIKEDVAIQIENNLKNPQSPYYLGKKYEHLLDFTTANTHQERYNRLANYKDHYYSYLYAGLYLAEIENQWKKAGFDIHSRPEIVATLFNIGFKYSHPKDNPSVGGSMIMVNGTPYTFGKLAYDFYYSGQLMEEFPYDLFADK